MSDGAEVNGGIGTDSVGESVLIKPAIVAPIVLTGLLIWAAFEMSPWALIGIPFAVLGTLCGQPNGNLGDGCLAVICGAVGLLIFTFLHQEIGMFIFASSIGGFFAGVFEKRVTAVPYDPSLTPTEEATETSAPDE